MASPHVFLSSPSRAKQREYQAVRSSSPDLPPLQDFVSQKSNRSALRSGSKATAIPENVPTNFVSARSLWRSAQAAAEPSAIEDIDAATIGESKSDALTPVADIPPVPVQAPKSRKPRKRKEASKPTAGVEEDSRGPRPTDEDRPWKKYQSPPRVNASRTAERDKLECDKMGSEGRMQTGTMSNHFAPPAQLTQATKAEKQPEEPLHLEPAAIRRMDWTPPAQKSVINIDSDSSALRPLKSSPITGSQDVRFKDLLQSYTCQTDEPSNLTAPSDEDSSFLKKRKLIELVVTKDSNSAIPAAPEKSPVKQKAPKKKPRTITAIATAAYKPATQAGSAPPASLLTYFPNDGTASEAPTAEAQKKGKGASKPHKKTTKASKKKGAPPKPVLFSPGTALRQVANQDFVFGTSSQLAREPSPTLLRDLQMAMRHSNQVNDDVFATPINSDVIEPPELRPKLWEAGNRDAEGDLFDIEVIDLADGSPQLPPIRDEVDPFGYFKPDDVRVDAKNIVSIASDGSFVNLSDILPATGAAFREPADNGSPDPPSREVTHSTNASRRPDPMFETNNTAPTVGTTDEGTLLEDQPKEVPQQQPPQPNFGLYTDIQLSKEITSYGFKPVKRRNAMIALLEQCWQSKVQRGQAGFHTSTSLAIAPKSKKPATPDKNTKKKPRGRVRKLSINALEPQEPPPSAQPVSSPPISPSPRKPRGRPRKEAASPSKASSSRAKPKPPTKAAAVPSTPKRKRAATKQTAKPVIEIPDSASDNLSDLESSPRSTSPEEMFSTPPPVDLSLGEDTELSLAASPDDQQTALFSHITKAITTAPRTTDPTNPSWHEKILLYDTIILEDLTTWLNSGQLTRVGYDEEIYPTLVKKWCESKSVCSVWRVNLRGKERKRL